MIHEFIPLDNDLETCQNCPRSYEDHLTERVGIYDEDEIYGTEYLDLSGYAPLKEEW